MVTHSPEGPAEKEAVEMAKLPVEAQVLKLISEGLSQEVAAARCGITTNHAWAIRALAGVPRPVSEKQHAIARAIVERKRVAEPARKMAAIPGPKTAAKSRARRSSK
jgi:hypothetical protein